MIERGYNPVAYHFIQAADGVTKDALGANAEAVFGRSAWESTLQTPASQAFTKLYQAKYGRLPSYHSAAAYAAAEVAEAAIKAKGAERKGVRDFLASAKAETVMGTYQVNEKGQQQGYRYFTTQWQGGNSKVVGNGSSTPVEWPKPAWK
jgi:ABC-type branched-subunit amino acid transport system substrate-binding protein